MKFTRANILFASVAALFAVAACEPASGPLRERQVGFDASTAAVVNGEPIYISDVELEAVAQGRIEPGESFGPDHTEYPVVLDMLIDQRLLAQEAVRRGLDRSPQAQRRLETARERLLGNFLMESVVSNEVTDAAIDQMYDEQVELQQLDDEVRIRHILVDTEEEAQDVLRKARAGTDFTTLAFDFSRHVASRLEGGSLGWNAPNDLVEPFPSVIADTPVGEISEPFESEQGWHILKVEERRTQPPLTKAEMRPKIVTFLTFTEISKMLRELRADANIQARDGGPADLSYLDNFEEPDPLTLDDSAIGDGEPLPEGDPAENDANQ